METDTRTSSGHVRGISEVQRVHVVGSTEGKRNVASVPQGGIESCHNLGFKRLRDLEYGYFIN